MIDPTTLSTVVASTVAVLAPLLGKAAEKGAEKIGEWTITSLIEKFKNRAATNDNVKEALTDLTQTPTDADNQATLRTALKKAIQNDPTLLNFMQDWLTEAEPVAKDAAAGVHQTANVHGDNNITTQIAGGGGNTISIGAR